MPSAIDRREALRRAALILGGVISTPVIAGVLAGCGRRRSGALSLEQLELVATIADHILPETDTPGARAVGVHEFIDAMLAEAYAAEERTHHQFAERVAGGDLGARPAEVAHHEIVKERQAVEREPDDREQRQERRRRDLRLRAPSFRGRGVRALHAD